MGPSGWRVRRWRARSRRTCSTSGGEALLNPAEVLGLAGKDSRAELEQALALYERKGNLVMAERTRSQLAANA
jgi:hypothetical protein